jgi:ubiquitin C-terminal hydrolase
MYLCIYIFVYIYIYLRTSMLVGGNSDNANVSVSNNAIQMAADVASSGVKTVTIGQGISAPVEKSNKGVQEDAMEFMTFLLDALHEEMVGGDEEGKKFIYIYIYIYI